MLKVTIMHEGFPQHTFKTVAIPPAGRSWQLNDFGTKYFPHPGGTGVKTTDEGRFLGTFTWEAAEVK